MRDAPAPRVAYFISSHGFGHAARAAAVIEATWRLRPDVSFELFTTVPEWFFADSLQRPIALHAEDVDLGLVQADPLHEDLAATARELERRLPFATERVDALAEVLGESGCRLVASDISPLGLEVARRAGLPSLLVENFTWDWIYRRYASREPALGRFAEILSESFAGASCRLQAEPFCERVAEADTVAPVSRRPRRGRAEVRRRLGVPEAEPLVLVSMGGIEWSWPGLAERLESRRQGPWLLVPGSSPEPRRLGRAVLLPHRSGFYHPDLVAAADAVVAKLGYSTLAEVDRAGLPLGYVPRPSFPESAPLEAWVEDRLPSRRIAPERFAAGAWLDELEPLVALERRSPPGRKGAAEVARRLIEMLDLSVPEGPGPAAETRSGAAD